MLMNPRKEEIKHLLQTVLMIKPVIAAGGVVYRYQASGEEPEVLLIHRNGYWDIPKGKLEKEESIPMCAVREVAEETGSEIPAIVSDLGTTYHEYKEKRKVIGKTTYWYSMIFLREQQLSPQIKEGIQSLEWVELPVAIKKVGFENLREVLYSFGKSISQK